MDKIKSTITKNIKPILGVMATLAVGLAFGIGLNITIQPGENKTEVKIETGYTIQLSEQQKPAVIEKEDGQLEEISVPTVEEIDGKQAIVNEEELPELGQGAYYDISSPQAFQSATFGKCINLDGSFGAQCVDLAAAFWLSYSNRWPSVCGTGAARGMWDCKEQNAGEDYELITDPTKLQAGDWAIFNGGKWGHVGMAVGPENGGYVALFGQNQGGSACADGGSAGNIINMSTKTFLGAFRPKDYIIVEPEPTPIPITGCTDWNVERGDTMLGIGLTCENVLMNMEQVSEYAKTWWSQIYNPGQTVYDGWTSENGYGLFAGDYIIHEVGEQ